MKVLHISTHSKGGAAAAAVRLHRGLLASDIQSSILFFQPPMSNVPASGYFKRDYSMIERSISLLGFKQIPQVVHKKRLLGRPDNYDAFTFADLGYDITRHPLYEEADIINLHWVSKFVRYHDFFLKNGKPLVWTLHDMNPFTGGCHYAGACDQYVTECDVCPQVSNTPFAKEVSTLFKYKRSALRSSNINIVSPSKWLLDAARRGSLLSHVKSFNHIPYGVDTATFAPVDRKEARKLLGLPVNKKVILFVSENLKNRRKGFDLLLDAVDMLKGIPDVSLVSVGMSVGLLPDSNMISLGQIRDEEKMALAYSAADLFVVPSREDNLPNVVLESIACGTPVVAFDIGGLPDIIVPGVTGTLCKEVSSKALSEAILDFLNGNCYFKREVISDYAKSNFSISEQAESYLALYNRILNKCHSSSVA